MDIVSKEETLQFLDNIERISHLVSDIPETLGVKELCGKWNEDTKKDNIPIVIPQNIFRSIICKHNELVMETVLDGNTYDLGNHLGMLLIKVVDSTKNGITLIDWQSTKEVSKELGHLKLIPYTCSEIFKLAWLSGKSIITYYFKLYNFKMSKGIITYKGEKVNPKKQLSILAKDTFHRLKFYRPKKFGGITQLQKSNSELIVAKYSNLSELHNKCPEYKIKQILRVANYPHLSAYGYRWKIEII